jgi:hypothetical protein
MTSETTVKPAPAAAQAPTQKAALQAAEQGRAAPRRKPSLFRLLSSLKLTVVLLCFSVALVFIGTLAQTNEGLYASQNRYFRSLLVFWTPTGSELKIPVFPGGYLVGGLLLFNLFAAHAERFTFTRKKIGIFLIHAGIVLMILGQFATDLLSRESAMQLSEGETRNYSESFRHNELVFIDSSDPKADKIIAVPDSLLSKRKEVKDDRVPFQVRLINSWPNVDLSTNQVEGSVASGATAGFFKDLWVVPRPLEKDNDRRDIPAVVVELIGQKGSLGKFLLSTGLGRPERISNGDKPYLMAYRIAREYYPFSLTLLKATHEQYKGTQTPKNFASRVRVEYPEKSEARETVIYMNNPLRYAGLTFFQYQMMAGEAAESRGATPTSTFEVVHNPGWLTPYLSCIMVAAGLIIQFMTHLVGFVTKRKAA